MLILNFEEELSLLRSQFGNVFFLTDIDERVILTFLAPLGISVSLALPFLLTLESYCFTFSSHLEPLPPQMPHLSDFTGDPIICVKCKEEGK